MKVSLAADTVTPASLIRDGFFSPGQSKSRYLGLWYRQSPDTVVALTVSNKGNLVLLDQKNETTWSSNVSCDVKSPVAQLLDGGNLVVRDNSSTNTTKATLLMIHPLESLLTDFNIQVLPKLCTYNGSVKYTCTGQWSGFAFVGAPYSNFLYDQILVQNEDEISFRYESYNSPNIMILKLEHSGQLTRVIWNERRTAWDLMFSVPDKYCAKYGYCGANSICSLNQTPMCECLKGFQFQSQDNKTGSVNCKRSHSSDCKSGDQFTKLEDFKAPDLLEVSLNESMNLNQCQAECLKNCTCRAYANSKLRGGGSGC
ncbi:G-type lectin S-receptor-like serine/threonine-protein kinase [Citrus sinensis]|nr:G-type lectin S-receptor-like serine/threonine-protein kinase [Citrus sinensis]